MLLKFWGTRGSIPSPLRPVEVEQKLIKSLKTAGQRKIDLTNPRAIEEFVAGLSLAGSTVGSNTTCVTVELENDLFIFDAGSGIRELGEFLMDENSEFAQKFGFYRGKGHAHIFFTHTHWDHIQGFIYFKPIFVPGNIFDIYYVHDYVPEVLARQMKPETFPFQFDQLDATVTLTKLEVGQSVEISTAKITNMELNHPGKAYAYRIEANDAVVVLATDGEYTDLDYANMKKYYDFYANADALIFDAMFSVRDSFIKEDWGHSSALIGVDIARESAVKRLFLFHHDHTATDIEIMQVLQKANEYLKGKSDYPQIIVAKEGMELELGNPTAAYDFYINDYVKNDVIFISLSGKLGAQVTRQFKEHLTFALQKHSIDKVVLIMENLNELTMAGLRALVDARKDVISLALVGLPEEVYRVIELSGTTDFFAIYEDEEAALTALNARYR